MSVINNTKKEELKSIPPEYRETWPIVHIYKRIGPIKKHIESKPFPLEALQEVEYFCPREKKGLFFYQNCFGISFTLGVSGKGVIELPLWLFGSWLVGFIIISIYLFQKSIGDVIGTFLSGVIFFLSAIWFYNSIIQKPEWSVTRFVWVDDSWWGYIKGIFQFYIEVDIYQPMLDRYKK